MVGKWTVEGGWMEGEPASCDSLFVAQIHQGDVRKVYVSQTNSYVVYEVRARRWESQALETKSIYKYTYIYIYIYDMYKT